MKYSKLGSSGLDVSRVCLGTMTWGEQNTEKEGHEQIEYALDQGINFIDTAELYSVPPREETYGATETIIGTWIEKNQSRRDKYILATKMAGVGLPWIRNGSVQSGAAVREALEGSLKRLKTDYVDLYQLHWPNRAHPHFGKHWAGMIDPTKTNAAEQEENLLDILKALGALVKEGKIRHIGLSDDTPWGISKYLELASKHDLPRMVSIQNEYSFIHQKDDPFLTETCVMEDVAYLPWSPLGTGALTGKYLGGARPEGARWTIPQRNGPFRDTQGVEDCVSAFVALAKKHDLDPAQMALAWCDQKPFVTSTIIGATSMEQLKTNIDAFDITLSAEVLDELDKIYRQYPIPF